MIYYIKMYTLINSNTVFPEQSPGDFNKLIVKLQELVLNQSLEYCKNIYILETNGVLIVSLYFSNGTEMFQLNAGGIQPFKNFKTIELNKDCLQQMKDFLTMTSSEKMYKTKNEINETKDVIIEKDKTKNELKDVIIETKNKINETKNETIETKDEINETKNETIETKNEINETKDEINETKNEINETKDEINETKDEISVNNNTDEIELFNECEKILESFANEKKRQKTLKSSVLALEKKEKELLKKKFEIIQNKIIKVVGNFKTYSNIKKSFKDTEIIIPEIFKTQYEYFESEMNEEEKYILSNVDDLLILNSTEFDEKLIEIANKFDNDFKTKIQPSLGFTHTWMELESDNINLH